MANRITLDIGGKFDGQFIKQADASVRNFQHTVKDANKGVRDVVGGIAGSLGGTLSAELKETVGILSSFATGGVWWLAAGAFRVLADFAVSQFLKARQAAEDFAHVCESRVAASIGKINANLRRYSTAVLWRYRSFDLWARRKRRRVRADQTWRWRRWAARH